jgi:hypothetical protein
LTREVNLDTWLECKSDLSDLLPIAEATADEWVGEKRKVAETAAAPDRRQHFATHSLNNGYRELNFKKRRLELPDRRWKATRRP